VTDTTWKITTEKLNIMTKFLKAKRTAFDEDLKYSVGQRSLNKSRLYVKKIIASEISRITRYMDSVIQLDRLNSDRGEILEFLACKEKISTSLSSHKKRQLDSIGAAAFLFVGNFNYHLDLESMMVATKLGLRRQDRVIAVVYNPLLKWMYEISTKFGLREGEIPTTFLTKADVLNLARLSGYEVTSIRETAVVPFFLFGLGDFLNRFLPVLPFFRRFAIASVVIFRPIIPTTEKLKLSVVIPARNERGNIEAAVARLLAEPFARIEIIFVEGHSSDGTWNEIERVKNLYQDRLPIFSAQQSGKGKGDAVRLGFNLATGDLLTILDADLTMPPESLHRFYDAYISGLADFVNGSRLVYPMEGEAMRFLNKLGNIFFAKALTFVLGTHVGDSLCGTKLVSRNDYYRFKQWREDFGEFDPFGDFELIFPASILNLGVIDVPIRYRARTYGQTNISRFSHGWMLLKMTMIGFFRIKVGKMKV
jgi:hypothetical protein